jgi:hypothetical protein
MLMALRRYPGRAHASEASRVARAEFLRGRGPLVGVAGWTPDDVVGACTADDQREQERETEFLHTSDERKDLAGARPLKTRSFLRHRLAALFQGRLAHDVDKSGEKKQGFLQSRRLGPPSREPRQTHWPASDDVAPARKRRS